MRLSEEYLHIVNSILLNTHVKLYIVHCTLVVAKEQDSDDEQIDKVLPTNQNR